MESSVTNKQMEKKILINTNALNQFSTTTQLKLYTSCCSGGSLCSIVDGGDVSSSCCGQLTPFTQDHCTCVYLTQAHLIQHQIHAIITYRHTDKAV